MGQGKLGLIHARDLADFAARVLTSAPDQHHGSVYTLTGPASISFQAAAAQLSRGIDKPVAYVPVPQEARARACSTCQRVSFSCLTQRALQWSQRNRATTAC